LRYIIEEEWRAVRRREEMRGRGGERGLAERLGENYIRRRGT